MNKGGTTQADKAMSLIISNARKKLNVLRVALAKALDISYQQVAKYETGVNRISFGKLVEIAKVLKLDISFFIKEYKKTIKASEDKECL